MATYVNDLRLKEITTGTEDGTWGTATNTNLSLIADAFSYGTKQMAADANETFTMPDGTADGTRSIYLKITSAGALTGTRTVTLGPNTVSKMWFIENATTGGQSINIKQGSGAEITILTGDVRVVYTDGAGAGAAVTDATEDLYLVSPTLTTPALGTPTAVVLTNATGLPLATGVTGTLPVANGGTGITSLGTGVATWLGTPSSANLAAAVTDETGSGSLVFSTSPTLVTPALGTPSALVLTNATGLPLTTGVIGTLPAGNGGTGITALGTGVATALGVNVGSVGAFVTFNGAGGTPSSITLTNGTGLVLTTGVTGTLPLANGGTAATTAAGARASILPTYAGNAGKGLVVNVGETDVEYIALAGSGTVTSVNASGGTTGLTFSGGPVTTTGTLTLAGTLAATNGGTGLTALGTGVATALGINVGSAGAFVTFNGALGTPSSGTLTSATGLPLTTGVTGTLPVANGGTNITSYTAGDLLYATGATTLAKLAAGTASQVLAMNSGATAPEWSAPPSAVGATLFTYFNYG